MKQTANTLDVPESLVSDLIHMYWKKVRQALTSLEHIRVRVDNLGTFTLRAKKLRMFMNATERKLQDVDQSSFSGYKQYDELSVRHSQLKNAMNMFEDEWAEKKEHYETRKKTSTDLEE